MVWMDDALVSACLVTANRGHVEVCRVLLDQGANINLGDFHGWTALYLAAMHGASGDLIQLLLEVSPRQWIHSTYTLIR